jgi:hypothetical protein
LAQVLRRQLRRASLHLDDGDELFIEPHAKVGELALDLVLVGQLAGLVVAEGITHEVGDQ